ncbi:MAG: ABC transporter ATP-binding protein, partial [Ruminiclostridium sp.]|nr:ABC transporter ATP-binding protein [Ruminiclostridium sp.]
MTVSDSDMSALKWIYKASEKQRLRLVFLVIGNTVFAVASVFFALLCRNIVDGATDKDPDAVIKSGIGLFLIIAVMLVLRLFCNSLNEVIRAGLEKDLRSRMLSSILKKEYGKSSDYNSGELLNRMFSDVAVVVDGTTAILPAFANMVTKLIGATVILLMLDLSFTLVFLCAGTVIFVVSRVLRKRIKHLHKNVQETNGIVRFFLQETLENRLTVKVFGTEEKMERINERNQQEHYKARMKRRTISILANGGFGFIFQAGYLYAILWGAFKIIDGAMTYGTLTAILQFVNQIQQP